MKRLLARFLPALLVAACGASPATNDDLARADTSLLLIGEQHDEPEHQQLQRQAVDALASRGLLAALALEMADAGASTQGLSPQASEAEVRAALRWNNAGWPWATYAPPIMAAVSAGVPVFGANLPRARLRAAMADPGFDTLLPGPALKAQQQSIRLGHCGLLPESQIAPMTRVQIARDQAMARTLEQLAVPGKTVLLIAGGGHVDPAVGVPRYLPARLSNRSVLLPKPLQPRRDYCEDMKRSLAPRPAS